MEEYITLETAKMAKEKGIDFYSNLAYYIVLEDTYHTNHHNGDEYLAYKKNEVVRGSTPPYDTKNEKIHWAYTQTRLQRILRDDHKIHITINYIDDVFGFQSICTDMVNNIEFYQSCKPRTYNDALEIGLINGLKHI